MTATTLVFCFSLNGWMEWYRLPWLGLRGSVMRLPRPRFTVRRLIVAVAVVALIIGTIKLVEQRRLALSRESLTHRYLRYIESYRWRSTSADPDAQLPPQRYRYEKIMDEKYTYAARYPWMPVMPDPPKPE